MEPITLLMILGIYASKAIKAQINENKAKKSYSSSSSSSSKSSVSVSQSELKKKKQDDRICQPEIKLSDNNKFKAE